MMQPTFAECWTHREPNGLNHQEWRGKPTDLIRVDRHLLERMQRECWVAYPMMWLETDVLFNSDIFARRDGWLIFNAIGWWLWYRARRMNWAVLRTLARGLQRVGIRYPEAECLTWGKMWAVCSGKR